MIRQYLTTLRLTLLEQAHNRFAALLLLGYLPAWYGIIYSLTDNAPIGFRLRAFHIFIVAGKQDFGLLSGMLNATTLIMGFIALSVVRRSAAVDRRLVLCGHARAALILGRLTAFALVAALVTAYAVAVLEMFTSVRHTGIVAAGTFGAVVTYAAIGIVVGVVTRGDLEGFFLVIMLSLVDTFVQNPLGIPAANKQIIEYLPTYLPMQMVTGGALADRVAWWQFWGSLGWAAALGLVGVVGFWASTRTVRREARPAATTP